MIFDLQLFGGKGPTTYESKPADPTPQELRLQNVQANFAEQTAPNALALQKAGTDMLFNNPGIVPVNYTQLGQTAANSAQGLQGQAGGIYGGYDDLNNQVNALKGVSSSNLQAGTGMFNNQTTTNKANTAFNAQTMKPLMNGQLPSAYADNQAYAINRGLQTSMGNLLANNASRGIINSSAMNTGIQGLSDSLANTLSANYNQNLAQAAALQNQNANQQQMGFTNQSGIDTGLMGLQQQDLTNQQNLINMNSNMLNAQGNNLEQQRGLLSSPMELLNSAQNASIDIPNKLLAMSQGQQANTNDLWNNMAQQRIASKPDVAVVPGNGGLFGGLMGGVGSYLGAKR